MKSIPNNDAGCNQLRRANHEWWTNSFNRTFFKLRSLHLYRMEPWEHSETIHKIVADYPLDGQCQILWGAGLFLLPVKTKPAQKVSYGNEAFNLYIITIFPESIRAKINRSAIDFYRDRKQPRSAAVKPPTSFCLFH